MKILLALALSLLAFAYRSLGSGGLDGSVWEVKVRPRALFALSRKDTLAFDRGRLSSARFLGSGFAPGGYSHDAARGAGGSFSASLARSDGSTLDWSGRVTGDRVKGELLLTSADGKSRRYSFHGRRRT